jgi:tRNA 2-thiocytidine biosynthesis protein TtcA
MRDLTKTGHRISNAIGKAIADHDLIRDKDRILVAVSGGKDSLAMLKLLHERKKWAPIKYELIAMHIQTDYHCAGCVHTETLKKFFDDLDTKYIIEKISIVGDDRPVKHACGSLPDGSSAIKKPRVSCFWCSWNRRKALFLAADRLKCNKIALGHHKDDIIETLLLNMFYHGEFSAMNPRQELFKGALTIIRPLCYVEEEETVKFAKESGFPSQMCRCPNSQVSKRRMVKQLIKEVEKDCEFVRTNLFRSMTRIKKDYIQVGAIESHSKSSCEEVKL